MRCRGMRIGGYGFPIGGVAAFDPEQGVVATGGVGFDISCGVRTMLTGLRSDDIRHVQHALADSLMRDISAGVGSEGAITLDDAETEAMLRGGAAWAIWFRSEMGRLSWRLRRRCRCRRNAASSIRYRGREARFPRQQASVR